ncbi:ABC-three component system protein [Pseudomonas sp. TWI672]|uniref:ABC-three component system protein n=1 Tax=unclassified Pseudomonas TaxID=196821 RepID=UPI00320B4402
MTVTSKVYPPTAVSTWSGYVYQGKIALYHSLKLITEGDEDFELQLDSSDDFAIYKSGALVSAHQVKAKIGTYRNEYTEALEKSSKIEHDRIAGVSRFFHVSVQLNDTSDYTGTNKELVKFYLYGNNSYCGLGEIEELTKSLIKKICLRENEPITAEMIHYNYCLLSERISTQAVAIHRIVQVDRERANKVAYEQRIHAKSLITDIAKQNPYSNTEYYAVDLRAKLHSHLEDRLDNSLLGMSDEAYGRACRLFDHIRDSPIGDMQTLCQLMKPSERFSSLQKADIRRYSTLIEAMAIEPVYSQFPHYLDGEKQFYLPTALDVPYPQDEEGCIADLLDEMEGNENLLRLLFEYNNLIPSRASKSFVINTKFTQPDDLEDQQVRNRIDSNILKSLCISIVTKEDAEARLNDK